MSFIRDVTSFLFSMAFIHPENNLNRIKLSFKLACFQLQKIYDFYSCIFIESQFEQKQNIETCGLTTTHIMLNRMKFELSALKEINEAISVHFLNYIRGKTLKCYITNPVSSFRMQCRFQYS